MGDIVLYSTGCPQCQILKTKMNLKNISFVENTSKDDMIKHGFKSAPMLQVGDKFMTFIEAIQWIKEQ